MTSATLTTEEIYALPDDGFERDLIRGKLQVYPSAFRTCRNAEALAAVCQILGNWARTDNANGGVAAASNVGVRLRRDPDTFIGLDATFYSAETLKQTPADQPWYEGPPVLAVEILAPKVTHGSVVEKIRLCLEYGVRVVWILDPDFRTLNIYRSDTVPVMLGIHDILDGNPELPGLNVPVRDFFI